MAYGLGPVFELSILYTVAGIKCVNTLHFGVAAGNDPAPSGLVADYRIACEATWLSMQRAQTTLNGYVARKRAPLAQANEQPHEVSLALAGTRASDFQDFLPPSYPITVSLKTTRTGKTARGRNYVSGGTEGDMGSGGWRTDAGGFHAVVKAHYDNLVTRMGEDSSYVAAGYSGLFVCGVLSRKGLLANYLPAVYFHGLKAAVVRAEPRSLRSRRA